MDLLELRRLIGDQFRAARKGKGLTLQQVEDATGLSVSRVSNYEQGIRLAGPEQVKALGALYEVAPAELLLLDEESLLPEDEQRMLTLFRACSPEAQDLLLQTAALHAARTTQTKSD